MLQLTHIKKKLTKGHKQLMQIIKVVNNRHADTISLFLDEPTYVVIANRTDMPTLQQIDEAKKPGIYVLLGPTQRYVGQASGSIVDRLKKHDVSKPWWRKVVFFGVTNGNIDKAKLDYIEKKLITMFKATSYHLMNETGGNSSFIETFAEWEANQLVDSALHILNTVANVDIFDDGSLFQVESVDETSAHANFVRLSDGFSTDGDSARDVLTKVGRYLLAQYHLPVAEGLPSRRVPYGTAQAVSKGGSVMSKSIGDGVEFYVHFSRADTAKYLEYLAELAGLIVVENLK